MRTLASLLEVPDTEPVSIRTGSGVAAQAAAHRMHVKARRENGLFIGRLP